MPQGSKRPYTKEQKLSKEFDKSNRKLKNLQHNSSDPKSSLLDAAINAVQVPGARKKSDAAEKAMKEGPKGIKSSQITTKGFPKDLEGRDWKEIKSNKNGTYTTQVTPGKWETK